MQIALIQPPCWGIMCPPYNLAVLSAYLRKNGHEVFIRDLNIEFYHARKKEYKNAWNPEEHFLWINPRLVCNFIFDHSEIIDEKIDEIFSTGARIIGMPT